MTNNVFYTNLYYIYHIWYTSLDAREPHIRACFGSHFVTRTPPGQHALISRARVVTLVPKFHTDPSSSLPPSRRSTGAKTVRPTLGKRDWLCSRGATLSKCEFQRSP